MSERKRKCYIVTTLHKGRRELWSETKRHAWKAALARGWRPVSVEEKKEVKKVA